MFWKADLYRERWLCVFEDDFVSWETILCRKGEFMSQKRILCLREVKLWKYGATKASMADGANGVTKFVINVCQLG